MPPTPQTPITRAGRSRLLRNLLLTLLVLACFFRGACLLWPGLERCTFPWLATALPILALATLVAGLARQLPLQNVVLASAILMGSGLFLNFLDVAVGVPFGIRFPGEAVAQPAFWLMPLIWCAALLCCRGVARVLLTRFRENARYGYLVLGLTVLLVLLFDLSLQPFATIVENAWSWQPSGLPLNWYGIPAPHLLGWTVSALLIIAVATPSLINKRPALEPLDYSAIYVWLSLQSLYAVGAGAHHLYAAAILAGGQILCVLAFLAPGSPFCRSRRQEA